MSALAQSPTSFASPAPLPAPVLRALGELSAGETGRIVDVTLSPADASRLKALGVCAGRTVQVVSGGNPMIVRVLNSRVGLAAAVASQVTLCSC